MNLYRPLLTASLSVLLLAAPFTLAFAATEAPSQTPEQSALRINEFMAANNGGLEDPDEPGTFPDWIELYNPSAVEVNLNGLAITDDPAQPARSPFPDGVTIPAGGFLLLFADGVPAQGPRHLNFSLGRNGETIGLYNAATGTAIDTYTYGPQNDNISEGRESDGGATWRFFNSPTPGTTNALFPPLIGNVQRALTQPTATDTVTVTAVISDERGIDNVMLYYFTQPGATPTGVPMSAANGVYSGQLPALPDGTVVRYYVEATDVDNLTSRNPISAPTQVYRYTVGYQPPPLHVNEIMPSNVSVLPDPDQPDKFPDWIEIYNAGSEPLSLDGMFLTDEVVDPTKFPIPLGLPPVPAKGYVIFYADSDANTLGGYHTNFSLSNTGGEYVGLYAAGGNALVSEYAFSSMNADVSVGRIPDGSTNWANSACSTPSAANATCQLDRSIHLPLIVAQ